MAVVVSMLRGVNLVKHNRIKMEALRALYESLGFLNVQSYIQSGNVVFQTKERSLGPLAKRIEDGIEKSFGFRAPVVLRTTAEMREAVARNPFPNREPNRLLVTFLAAAPDPGALAKALEIPTEPEELRIHGREAYIYFPNGMARPKLSWPRIEKALKTSGTGRNWNTVTKLLDMAEALES